MFSLNQKLQEKMLLFKYIDRSIESDDDANNNDNQQLNESLMTHSSFNHNKAPDNTASHHHQKEQLRAYIIKDNPSKKKMTKEISTSFEELISTKVETKPYKGNTLYCKYNDKAHPVTTINQTNTKESNRSKYDISTRLYNHGFYVKNKLLKKSKEQMKLKFNRLSPDLLRKASNKVNHTAMNVEDRLYKASKPKEKKHLSIEYPYSPKIDKNSIRIAANLEPSMERLTKVPTKAMLSRKKHCDKSMILLNDYDHINHSTLIPSQKRSTKPNERVIEMYNKGLNQIKSKERKCEENAISKAQEHLQFPFKPHCYSSFTLGDGNMNKSSSSQPVEFYDKQTQWKNKVIRQKLIHKAKLETNDISNCTFTPFTNKKTLPNDERFILRYLNQINDYVQRRRKSLEKDKERECMASTSGRQIRDHKKFIFLSQCNKYIIRSDTQSLDKDNPYIASNYRPKTANKPKKNSLLNKSQSFEVDSFFGIIEGAKD